MLKCDHSNESYWEVRSCGTVFMPHTVVPTFESVDEILKCAIQMKVPEQYVPLICCLLCCIRWFCFESVDACTCALCNSSNSLCGWNLTQAISFCLLLLESSTLLSPRLNLGYCYSNSDESNKLTLKKARTKRILVFAAKWRHRGNVQLWPVNWNRKCKWVVSFFRGNLKPPKEHKDCMQHNT